jgi:transcriptional regulator with XRE-family HTH domain
MGLTQDELARKVKLSCGTISTLETGEARREQTLVEHVTHIARALRQDPGWLLTGEHSKVGDADFPVRTPMAIPTATPITTHVLNIGALQRAGRKIRVGRIALGFTQATFAAAVGTDPGTMSTIERGYNKTHFELHAEKCCQILGVDYDWLFTLGNGDATGAPIESPSEQMARLESKLDRIIKHFSIK